MAQKLPETDKNRLRHMLDAAIETRSFVRGFTQRGFRGNRLVVLAVVKNLEIIGEAASRITESTKLKLEGIPWYEIVGMRNQLIHAYFNIDDAVVWKTVTAEIPDLIKRLRAALKS